MQHLVFHEAGRVGWESAPDPQLSHGHEALLEPLAVARCDLDLPMAKVGLFPGPYPVGHEIAGRVAAVGDDVDRVRVGDVVIVPFQVSCGSCPPCTQRTFAACATHMAPLGGSFGFGASGGGHGGGLADGLLVPHADHLLVVPPNGHGLNATVMATLSDNVVDGYRSVVGPLIDHPGSDVLIVASTPGSLALYAAASACALGAGTVRYVDTDPTRVDAARSLGAEAIVHEGPWPKRFATAPITVDVTGDAAGLSTVIRSTDRYGYCTSLAIAFQPETPVPMLEMYTRGITFHTSRADSRRFLPEVVDLVVSGALDPLAIPTTMATWSDAAEAWLEPAIKLVVTR
jgi:threonine dehydrogenase-like Zn-dependent dehydrogenase